MPMSNKDKIEAWIKLSTTDGKLEQAQEEVDAMTDEEIVEAAKKLMDLLVKANERKH